MVASQKLNDIYRELWKNPLVRLGYRRGAIVTEYSSFSEELEGRVVDNVKELRELFPEDEKFGEVRVTVKNGYFVCYRDSKPSRPVKFVPEFFPDPSIPLKDQERSGIGSWAFPWNVGYRCDDCEKIVVGRPKIDINEENESLDFSCGNCEEVFYQEYCPD
ncbi:hypothetical protein CL618_01765 [archaeon]|nr:hypothetical protein [archaeon]|tara:strand:+ start:173 stop:655 length:483 start_codon:yes stop_codon:yes gene_type:complete